MKILQVNVTTSTGNDDADLFKTIEHDEELPLRTMFLLEIQLFDQFSAQHHAQRFENDTFWLNQETKTLVHSLETLRVSSNERWASAKLLEGIVPGLIGATDGFHHAR